MKTKLYYVFLTIAGIMSFYIGTYSKESHKVNMQNNLANNTLSEDKFTIVHRDRLPDFIKTDLAKYNIKGKNFTKIKWEKFLTLYTNRKISVIKDWYNQNIILDSILTSPNIDTNKIKFLVNNGLNPNKEDKNGIPPIYKYFSKGLFNKKTLNNLVNMGFDIHATVNINNKTYNLLNAAMENENQKSQKEFIRYLNNKNIKFNGKDFDNYIPSLLMYADRDKLILDLSSEIDLSKPYGKTTEFGAIIASQVKNITVTKLLENNTITIQNDPYLLNLAMGNMFISIQNLQKIVDLGANINSLDPTHQTPLFVAMATKNFERIKWLIQNGADIHIKDNKGKTALQYLEKGNKKFIQSKQESIRNIKNFLLEKNMF